MKRADLPVAGMSCAACARSIERALARTDGVSNARVNFATSTATVEYDAKRVDENRLVAEIRQLGYDVREDDDDRGRVPRLIVSGACAAALLPLGMLERGVWAQAILSLPVMLYAAAPFFRDAWKALLRLEANMNSLIALGSGAAFVYSWVELLRGRTDVYFEAAAVIVTLILVGRTLEAQARRKASESVRRLIDLRPQKARVERRGEEVEVDASALQVGDVVVLRPGERAACDGMVLSGESAMDESMLTGESIPAEKKAGDSVYRGTINRFGSLRFEARKVGADTALDRIIELVAKAQSSRAPVARLADTVSGWFTLLVLGIAAVTCAAWLWFEPGLALQNAVAVLIVACPCALGLATPVAIVAGTGRGADRGILIKSGEALERAARVTTVAFDKTGTLTEGRPRVAEIHPEKDFTEDGVLVLAAAAESDSEHPLARAIEERARGLLVPLASRFEAQAGLGVTALVEGREVEVRKAPQGDASPNARGLTLVDVSIDGDRVGTIGIADQARKEAAKAIRLVRDAGYRTLMLTGDNEGAAARIAQQTGVETFRAGLLPEGKEEEIARLQDAGEIVAMVGDGINDAPALARADVGIAIGSGADAATETGDITILRNDLRAVPEALDLAKRTMRVIRQNLFWAFGYNVLAIPVAAGLLYPFNGWLLSPMIASGAMAFSSLSVVLNSLRLRRSRGAWTGTYSP